MRGKVIIGNGLVGSYPYALIGIAVVILYFKTISFGFTYLDDNVLILNNYHYLTDLSNIIRSFGQKVFPDSFLPYYRPGLMISFMIDANLGGSSLRMYHITNILLHMLASSLIYLSLVRLSYGKRPALLFGLIFAVHPALSQAVAWLPGRNDSLLAVFILASFVSLISYLRDGRSSRLFAHLFMYVAALFTKESAVVFAPICLIYMHLVASEPIFSRRERLLLGGWVLTTFIWFGARQAALKGSITVNFIEIFDFVIKNGGALIQFIGKMLFPFNLSVFPSIEDTTYIFGVFALLAIVVMLAQAGKKRRGYALFGLAWVIFFLAPSLIRPNYSISVDFLEHRIYLAMLGLFIIIMESRLFSGSGYKQRSRTICVAVIMIVFALLAFGHSDNFRDRISFWSNASASSPSSSFAHTALGITYHGDKEFDKAEVEYKKSLLLDPLQPVALCNLGDIYLKKDRLKEALVELKKSIAVAPINENAYLTIGVVYYRLGDWEKAESSWKKSLSINENNVYAMKNLAIFYKERGEDPMALRYIAMMRNIGLEAPVGFEESLKGASHRDE